MYRIGEFSKINRITVKTLRHYDELGLLKPEYVDEMSGYRYYTSDQLPVIQKIMCLKQIGLCLADIAVLLREGITAEEMISRLQIKQVELTQTVADEQVKLKQLTTYLATLQKENGMHYHITIKDLPEVTVASMRQVIKDYNEFFTVVI